MEEHLLDGSFSTAIVRCFAHAERGAFENLLEPLQKILVLSPPCAAQLANDHLLSRAIVKLNLKKPLVRLSLLRIIRSICDASEEQGALIRHHKLYDTIESLSEHDPAILVRNIATDLLRLSELSDRRSIDVARYPGTRRTSSSTMTPPPLYNSSSVPSTPARSSAQSNSSYFDLQLDAYHPSARSRVSNINGALAYRPASREGPGSALTSGYAKPRFENSDFSSPQANGRASSPVLSNGSTVMTKSRLPHRSSIAPTTAPTRMGRPSTASATALKREENMPPPPTPTPTSHHQQSQAGPAPRNHMVINPRRRRQTSSGAT